MTRKPFCALAMVKDEGIFMPFWLKHYTKYFAPEDLYVHSDESTDSTEEQVRAAGVNFVPVLPGSMPVMKNDRYIKGVIEQLLGKYEAVLFAESPDDIIVPGPAHDYDLGKYMADFVRSKEPYRFLTGINIMEREGEAAYDPAKGNLIAQRSTAIRCPQYDNPFLWSIKPLWGRGWHDLGQGRLEGYGDKQGEDKRLYNLHIHYADFGLANARHHVRLLTYNTYQQQAYSARVDQDLRNVMNEMISRPKYWFSNGQVIPIEDWMKAVI